MADILTLYINADGLQNEHSESADSIKMASFKTANNELTDAALGNLIGGADANDEHIHDARYFRENEHINTSAGVADAGKPIILDAAGQIDNSMFSLGAIDHGGLDGLADDDHTQYSLVDGTRAYTGIISYNSHPAFSADTDIVDKKYVDDVLVTSEWYPYSALSFITDNTIAPPTEVLDDVYVLSDAGGAPNAAYDGAAAGDIVKFNGTLWIATTPTTGTKVSVDDEPNTAYYLFGGASWSAKLLEATTASNGLTKVGVDIQVDPTLAGNGLAFGAGVMSVNVDNSSLEINADTLRVRSQGIKQDMIDFGVGAGEVSAEDIPIADAGGYFTETDVEGALQELGLEIQQLGVEYVVGVGGVTIGDLVYINGSNTVLPYSTLTDSHRGIGIALSTETAGANVKVLANDTQVSGVTVVATPTVGDPVYWTGSQLSADIPNGGGQHVWQAGVYAAPNLLHVEVRLVKKNA